MNRLICGRRTLINWQYKDLGLFKKTTVLENATVFILKSVVKYDTFYFLLRGMPGKVLKFSIFIC